MKIEQKKRIKIKNFDNNNSNNLSSVIIYFEELKYERNMTRETVGSYIIIMCVVDNNNIS